MKRTQSKAVKPARKGAVKVPKGWSWLRKGALVRRGDRFYCLCRWKAVRYSIGCPFGYTGAPTYCIRRNPRAARANKGRKV